MIDRLLAKLCGERKTLSGGKDELSISVAALLLEAAKIDARFDTAEREKVLALLERRFGLSPVDAVELVAKADKEVERSAQLFGFVRTVNEHLTQEKKIELIDMLWEVAYADGVLDPLEDALLRRVGGLIDVPDRERGALRLRVMNRLGVSTAS